MEVSALAATLTATAVLTGFAGSRMPSLKKSGISKDKIEEILSRTGDRLYNDDSRAMIKRKIDQAGLAMEPEYIIGLRLALPAIYAAAALPFLLLGVIDIVWLLIPALVLFIAPKFWLENKAKKRKIAINKDILEFCTSLSAMLDAGADFLTATIEVCNSMKGELANEFMRAIDDISVGKRRSDALYDMASKTDIPDLIDLVRKIEQSERYGTPLAGVIKDLTSQIIMRRKYEGVRKAGELTIKLLFPTLLFIFGPMLGLLFYPVFVNMQGIF